MPLYPHEIGLAETHPIVPRNQARTNRRLIRVSEQIVAFIKKVNEAKKKGAKRGT